MKILDKELENFSVLNLKEWRYVNILKLSFSEVQSLQVRIKQLKKDNLDFLNRFFSCKILRLAERASQRNHENIIDNAVKIRNYITSKPGALARANKRWEGNKF